MRRRRIAFRAGIDQGGGFFKGNGLGRLVGRQRGIDAFMADIGAIAALLRYDWAALGRMVAEQAAGIAAKAASARPFGPLLRDERHRAVEADREDLFRRIEIGVSLAVLNIGSKTADTGADRLAVFGVTADLARQGKESKRALQIDFVGRGAFRQTGAPRFFAIDGFAKLQIGPEAAAAERYFQAGLRILAEFSGADFARAVRRQRQGRV